MAFNFEEGVKSRKALALACLYKPLVFYLTMHHLYSIVIKYSQ